MNGKSLIRSNVGNAVRINLFVVQVRINAFDARCSRNDDTKETSNSYKESSIVSNCVLYLAS
jgi:hypothetical protein